MPLHRYVRDSAGNASRALVETGTTDDQGHYTTQLPRGYYVVTVEKDGNETTKRVPLDHDRWVRVLLGLR